MRLVRGPGTENLNILDLGPLHKDVISHIERLIDNPDLALNADTDFRSANLDGQECSRPESIAAVRRMSSEFTHLKPLFVAFLNGALKNWH